MVLLAFTKMSAGWNADEALAGIEADRRLLLAVVNAVVAQCTTSQGLKLDGAKDRQRKRTRLQSGQRPGRQALPTTHPCPGPSRNPTAARLPSILPASRTHVPMCPANGARRGIVPDRLALALPRQPVTEPTDGAWYGDRASTDPMSRRDFMAGRPARTGNAHASPGSRRGQYAGRT